MSDETPQDPQPNVVPLFAANQLAPNHELQAQYLEAVAAQIRSNGVTYDRCLLILQPRQGELDIQPFGGEINNMEFVGLVEIAKQKFLLDFFHVVR